jgi:hypothetical protein
MAEEPKSPEQREREWWNAWWAEDYSWDGLAKKPWTGWVVAEADGAIHEEGQAPAGAAVRPATLQDYWREQEGDLIASPDGKARFTRVHLPPAWRDGTPTEKGDWADKALDLILAPRLRAGAQTKVSVFGIAKGADRRAQLQGAMLLRAATHPEGVKSPVHLKASGAAFLRGANFSNQHFGPGAGFNRATFSGNAVFESATFSGNAGFNRATFSGIAWFKSATFSGDAGFEGATFSGNAGFEGATFSGDAGFSGATFKKLASFSKTRGGEDKAVTFGQAAAFQNAQFEGVAQFEGAQFKGVMDFDTAVFKQFADFSGAGVAEKEPDWRGGFDGARFEASLDVRGLDLKAVSLFEGARFDRGVMLDRVDVKAERAAQATALLLARNAEDREPALRALESGALRLKQAMEAEKDYTREQAFHALELRARRLRKDTAWTEKVFSFGYLVFARYGASIGLPFAWLAAAIVGFAGFYWMLERGAGGTGASLASVSIARPVDADLVAATRYSLSRVFPLGTWDESDEPVRVVEDKDAASAFDCSFRERLAAIGECRPTADRFVQKDAAGQDIRDKNKKPVADTTRLELHRTVLALVSTLQTIFAGGLYFLFALAVRRKFQIG